MQKSGSVKATQYTKHFCFTISSQDWKRKMGLDVRFCTQLKVGTLETESGLLMGLITALSP